MTYIQAFFEKYCDKVDSIDLELIIARVIKKSREFVLAHPEFKLKRRQDSKITNYTARRAKFEPLAYILGQKEFYGLTFKVTRDTLIPRPETECLVDAVISNLKLANRINTKTFIIDIGTGSGNIIISIVDSIKKSKLPFTNYELFGIDMNLKALAVARYNAHKNDVYKKIKFIKSDLLNYFLKTKSCPLKANKLVIAGNLPYLSKKIFDATPPDVKKFEPKTALFSRKGGLDHYARLLEQIIKLKNKYSALNILCFLEFSPEQKVKLKKLIKKYFPFASIAFKKDLAGKWRVAKVKIS